MKRRVKKRWKKRRPPRPIATIDEIVARWRKGHYPPRPPESAEQRAAFFAEVRERCGFDPPADYHRLLELCDGGQNNAVWIFGAGERTSSHYEPTERFIVGDSGNVDLYIMRPDGVCEIRDIGESYVYESYPSIRAFLDALIKH